MNLYIDFDDTICDSNNVLKGYRMGQPMKGAVESLQTLAETNQITIFTSRDVRDIRIFKAVQGWLDYFKIPYNHITNIKGDADLYIDDRGLHFTNWTDIIHIIDDK